MSFANFIKLNFEFLYSSLNFSFKKSEFTNNNFKFYNSKHIYILNNEKEAILKIILKMNEI